MFNETEVHYIRSKHKYSLLNLINEDFLINGVYEFHLEYPQIPSYIRFNQTTNLNSDCNGIIYKFKSGTKYTNNMSKIWHLNW